MKTGKGKKDEVSRQGNVAEFELPENLSMCIVSMEERLKAMEENLSRISGYMARIADAVEQLGKSFASVIDPPLTLRHYTRGAALRIDQSQSRDRNPTW